MNKQIITVVLVVVLGVMAGILITAKPDQRAAAQAQAEKQQMIVSIKALQSSIDQLTTEIKALKAANLAARPADQVVKMNQPPAEDFTTVHKIDVAHSVIIGKKDAPVTIVEFMDFQCPFCGRFHPALDQMVEQYPDQVNYMIKNYPLAFHPQARPASKATFAAAEQGKYLEMVHLILQNQQSLNSGSYESFAQQIGLDVEKFKKDLAEKDAEWEKWINADIELGAKVGVRGTPTYFINGRKTRARTADEYKKEIDAILNNKQ